MNDDIYSYLRGLSQEAQEIIITKIERGETNLYHSIMAILAGREKHGTLKDRETENKHYREHSKRKTDISDISEPLFDEIFNYVFARFESKKYKHKQVKYPVTSKDNMKIAKGAMIKALEKCNVSDKNLVGMVGVLDYILKTTSEYHLITAYKEYLKEHPEQKE